MMIPCCNYSGLKPLLEALATGLRHQFGMIRRSWKDGGHTCCLQTAYCNATKCLMPRWHRANLCRFQEEQTTRVEFSSTSHAARKHARSMAAKLLQEVLTLLKRTLFSIRVVSCQEAAIVTGVLEKSSFWAMRKVDAFNILPVVPLNVVWTKRGKASRTNWWKVLCAVPGDLRAPFNLTMYTAVGMKYIEISSCFLDPLGRGFSFVAPLQPMVLAMKW